MDVGTVWFTILSRLLALQSIVLIPFLLFAAIRPPSYVEVEFPPPLGCSSNERKIVKVPRYPSFLSLAILIVFDLSDIIFIYPFTEEGIAKADSLPVAFRLVGIVGLVIHVIMAVGWSSVEPNWQAAEYKYGLWFSRDWTVYYMSFIVTATAIGIPLFLLALWLIIDAAIGLVPILGRAMYEAYAPLKGLKSGWH